MEGRIGCAPANGCHAARLKGRVPVTCDVRERVTIDLRGLGAALQARATAEHSTVAALARRAIVATLDKPQAQATLFAAEGAESPPSPPFDRQVVKVSVRLSAEHAVTLATRAREADFSQGAYIAGLLDGAPPAPTPPDHREAIAALLASTDQLAATSADINAFLRLLGRVSRTELEPYRARVLSLVEDVRGHLELASRLMTALAPPRGSSAAHHRRRPP
jgi:hypothetical protein